MSALWERLFETAASGALGAWLRAPRGSFAAARVPRSGWALLAGVAARAAAESGRSLLVLAPGQRFRLELRTFPAGQ